MWVHGLSPTSVAWFCLRIHIFHYWYFFGQKFIMNCERSQKNGLLTGVNNQKPIRLYQIGFPIWPLNLLYGRWDDDWDLMRFVRTPFWLYVAAVLLRIPSNILWIHYIELYKYWDFWSVWVGKLFTTEFLLNDLFPAFSRHHNTKGPRFLLKNDTSGSRHCGKNSLIPICNSHCASLVIQWTIFRWLQHHRWSDIGGMHG